MVWPINDSEVTSIQIPHTDMRKNGGVFFEKIREFRSKMGKQLMNYKLKETLLIPSSNKHFLSNY